ncbi:MAG TPA: NAD(P)/FAD-dependent oxidoreductase [Kofleriaceae bacterium]|nr:NAD(P)/FAD-dependent oxidoreductase [Kofleriaceae bacterium]
MSWRRGYDVVVIGSGPNGLAAAVALAAADLSVLVVEARAQPGGGCRTSALTEPGFLHDVCSAVHPLALASPWFRALGLDRAVEWVQPPAALAHVLPGGRVVTLERSIDETALQLGRDAAAYRALMTPLAERFGELLPMILGPLRWPAAPLLMARFGVRAIRSLEGLAASLFRRPEAPALLGGIAAHAMVPLDRLATASFALLLGLAGHVVGWPIVRGGARGLTDALVARLHALGGELAVGERIEHLAQLPTARAYVFDVAPRHLAAIAGDRLPASYRARLGRYRHGPGVFKIDWALRGPVPWLDDRCARAATVHLSGDLADLAAAERAVHAGSLAARPFTLFVQPTRFDPSRAPAGMHTAWAYCHVPAGAAIDATDAIEAHVEAFAPGFRDLVIARATMDPRQLAAYDPNYVGGDISGGLSDLRQLFFRPVVRLDPYATPAPDVFLCSSSTPPGGGVHGMCGYHAARSVLARVFGRRAPALAPAAGYPRASTTMAASASAWSAANVARPIDSTTSPGSSA